MDRPHVCQHCSATFMLASSLRTHAAHVHGEGLQAYLAENGWHLIGHSGNHGDATGDLNLDIIKVEVSEAESVQSSALMTVKQENGVSELHGRYVTCSQAGNHGDSTGDLKPDMIERVYSVQRTLVTDKMEHVISDLPGKSASNISGTHGDTAGDWKPDMIKIKMCDCEVDSVQPGALVTDTLKQTDAKQPDGVHCKVVAENDQLTSHTQNLDVPEKRGLSDPSRQNRRSEAGEQTLGTARGLRKPKGVHTGDKPHACNICQKRFVQRCHLKRHERIHTGSKPFSCNVCQKSFFQLYDLKSHERRFHTGDKPHACGVCQKRFFQRCHLKRHERIHTGDKLHACNVCEKMFIRLNDLKNHERIHTGDRPYACSLCEKRFRHLSRLKRHEHIHTGEKPYACNVCKKRFVHLSSLKRHKRLHTGEKPYVCNVCKKRFVYLSSLKRHKRLHTGDKPYVCNICEKRYIQLNDLKSHERIHTGDKPFACSECNKRFFQLSHLKSHGRIHT